MTLALAAVTGGVVLVFLGKISLIPQPSPEGGAVFYVVPYLYGYTFYDREFREVERMEVAQGEQVTLYIVPSHALSREAVLAYAERTVRRGIKDLAPGDPEIRKKIEEDFKLGNIEHIVGISGHPVYVQTDVTAVLEGRLFRAGGPRTVREAVQQKDPAIKKVTFTAKRVGSFDVLCVDSGHGGEATCGWGHQLMTRKGGLVTTEGVAREGTLSREGSSSPPRSPGRPAGSPRR